MKRKKSQIVIALTDLFVYAADRGFTAQQTADILAWMYTLAHRNADEESILADTRGMLQLMNPGDPPDEGPIGFSIRDLKPVGNA
jgi:hypothetical protein